MFLVGNLVSPCCCPQSRQFSPLTKSRQRFADPPRAARRRLNAGRDHYRRHGDRGGQLLPVSSDVFRAADVEVLIVLVGRSACVSLHR